MDICARCETRFNLRFDASGLCWPCRVEYTLDNPEPETIADMVSHVQTAIGNMTPGLGLVKYFELPPSIQKRVQQT